LATTFTPWIVPSTAAFTRVAATSPISAAAPIAPPAAAAAASSALTAVSLAISIAPSTAPTAAAVMSAPVADASLTALRLV